MHYRHACHAGNFADVFKHVLLIGLLEALNRKEKPWCYLDTHAGAGHYDLKSSDAQRTSEWQDGVGALSGAKGLPKWVDQFLEMLAQPRWTPSGGSLRFYPGSPAWASMLSRDNDRLICCETQAEILARLNTHHPELITHQRSGYESSGLLPPKEKRGLVLLDPPYEDRKELASIESFLDLAIRRFANGIYAIWYPIKNRHEVDRFLRRCKANRKSLVCELSTGARGEGQMRACGMLIINPPFGFAESAQETLAWLAPQLAQGPRPTWSVEAFTP